jgi:glyoxylase-like metal-dependent hydrolase (beta-lactamase superfamily II)
MRREQSVRSVKSLRTLQIALVAVSLCLGASAPAQDVAYSPAFLATVRRAADVIPGERPTSVGVLTPDVFMVSIAFMVEGGSSVEVPAGHPAFQIRFPRGWIMVDAAIDREIAAKSKNFSDEKYRHIHQALRDARLAVVTHEHQDHVAGLIRSPFLAEIQRHALLTRAQMRVLLDKPNDPRIKLDSATAARYLVVDYDPIMPIAPGVVLIKAAGHTPGSQMVYVRLASGRELVLAGDVVWHSSGIAMQRQKPEESTKDFGGEDRAAIAQQLRWLKELPAEITVVPAHDQALIDQLVARGVMRQRFELGSK